MLLTDDLAVASTNLLVGSFLPTSYLLSSAMPPQRGGRPLNQLVADNFQKIIIPGRAVTVQCRHCHKIMAHATTRQQAHLDQCDQYKRRSITNPDHHSIQITLGANIRTLAVGVAKRLNQTAAMAVNCYGQAKSFEREYPQRVWSFLYMVKGSICRPINPL